MIARESKVVPELWYHNKIYMLGLKLIIPYFLQNKRENQFVKSHATISTSYKHRNLITVYNVIEQFIVFSRSLQTR